jgi:phenol hydroxylase P1 protein
MLTQFMNDWFDETRKWIDAVLKTAAAESPENRAVIEGWTRNWSARAAEALRPVVAQALGEQTDEVLGEELAAFTARAAKLGLVL